MRTRLHFRGLDTTALWLWMLTAATAAASVVHLGARDGGRHLANGSLGLALMAAVTLPAAGAAAVARTSPVAGGTP